MQGMETITIDLDNIDIEAFDRIALDNPFYSREVFIHTAVRNLLDEHADIPLPPAADRNPGYSWFLNSTRYY